MMIQQTISQSFLCWAKRELFMYPAMFHHLPEHLASRYVILYACVTMALDSNGPIIQFHFTSLYLALKFFSYNIKITKGKDTYTIQVHK